VVRTAIRTWRCTHPGCFHRFVSDRTLPAAQVFHTHQVGIGLASAMSEVPMRYEGEMWR